MRLSGWDSMWYMSIPSAAFLMPPVFLVSHPLQWPTTFSAFGLTDWQVFRTIFTLSPSTFAMILLSGVLSLGHNLVQYMMVQSLSATHTAFAGNVNKAAMIGLSLCLGFEDLPGGIWSPVMLSSVLGNFVAFTAFTALGGGSSLKGGRDEETKALAAQRAR